MPIEILRELGDDFQLYGLQPFLTSTKRHSTHQRHRLIALVLVHFLQDHGLTTRTILDPQMPLPDDFSIRVGDLTDRGLAFYREAEQRWLRSIDRGKSPTDTTILAEVLRKIRRQTGE